MYDLQEMNGVLSDESISQRWNPASPPMVETVQLLNQITPPEIQLKKLQFHRLQASLYGSDFSGEKKSRVHYHLHIWGEVVDFEEREEMLLKHFVQRLMKVGYFRDVQLLRHFWNEDARALQFEVVTELG
ncbi:MAG: hypothetical protein D6732_01560 [Methanobacteriota archaeon]|nr:MAG: hypothetical protein D6732_01560 [Euryarchaeota archaeon]